MSVTVSRQPVVVRQLSSGKPGEDSERREGAGRTGLGAEALSMRLVRFVAVIMAPTQSSLLAPGNRRQAVVAVWFRV